MLPEIGSYCSQRQRHDFEEESDFISQELCPSCSCGCGMLSDKAQKVAYTVPGILML